MKIWLFCCKIVEFLFGKDPEIKIIYDDKDYHIILLVYNKEKAEAISQLIMKEQKINGITILTSVHVVDPPRRTLKGIWIKKAFNGNPVLAYIKKIDGIFDKPIYYVVFKNKVVQFFTGELTDVHGNTSTLYQNIAEDILGINDGVYFCTEGKTNDYDWPKDYFQN